MRSVERDLTLYVSNAAAVGLLISAVHFPIRSYISQAQIISAVAVMARIPGAGMLGAVAAVVGIKIIRDDASNPSCKQGKWKKLAVAGTAGALCLGLSLRTLRPVTLAASTLSAVFLIGRWSANSIPRQGIRTHVQPTMTIRTPLLYSPVISNKLGRKVYLKLDNLQPTGSFKDRGMSRYLTYLKTEKKATRVISSSGGNAGHAVAYVGKCLGLRVTVVVPKSAPQMMVDKIKSHGAEVTVHGDAWPQADELAREMVAKDPNAHYISPFDHPKIWEGHSTMIDEIKSQWDEKYPPSAIICCVGGGGLLTGIYQGLDRVGWTDTTVYAAETEGAASFAESYKQGKLAKIDKIRSIATTLGATQVSPGVLEGMRKHDGKTYAIGDVTDKEAVKACVTFLKDHRMLVEPACGAALSVLYTERHRKMLDSHESIVAVVCGGGGADLPTLSEWVAKVGLSKTTLEISDS
ncbi:hypothetical protein AAMO2058_001444700 [Amorphochlora amoebiformis]